MTLRLPASLLTLGLIGLAGPAAAAVNGTYATEGSFAANAGAVVIEGFETVSPVALGLTPVVAPRLTVNGGSTPIGVIGSPGGGFGAEATEGSRYLLVYAAGVQQGTIDFALGAGSHAFGFNITDVGETAGELRIRTDVGAYSAVGGVSLATFAGSLGSGNVQYFGITQSQAFSHVYLTVTGVDEAYGIDKISVSAVPEPASALLMLAGLAGVGVWRRRRT